MADFDQYLDEQRDKFEEELCDWLRIPSVSTDGQHGAEIAQAGQWIADQMTQLGLKTEIVDTGGNPIVLRRIAARRRGADRACLWPL